QPLQGLRVRVQYQRSRAGRGRGGRKATLAGRDVSQEWTEERRAEAGVKELSSIHESCPLDQSCRVHYRARHVWMSRQDIKPGTRYRTHPPLPFFTQNTFQVYAGSWTDVRFQTLVQGMVGT